MGWEALIPWRPSSELVQVEADSKELQRAETRSKPLGKCLKVDQTKSDPDVAIRASEVESLTKIGGRCISEVRIW